MPLATIRFVLICLLILPATLMAQDTKGGKDTTDIPPFPYEVVKDNPALFPKTYLTSGVLMATRPLHPSTFLTSMQGFYRYKQHGFVKATWDFPILADYDFQLRHVDEKEGLRTTDDFNVYNQFDLGIGYFVKDTTVKKFKTVLFRGEDSLLNKVNPPAVYKMNYRTLWGVRLGYFRNQGIVTNFFLDRAAWLDQDLNFIAPGGPTSVFNPSGALMYHTNWSVNAFYLGADFRLMNHAVVRARGKVRQNSRVLNAYADFFYAPITNINDVLVRNFETGEVTTHVLSKSADDVSFVMRSWGFRIGSEANYMVTEKSGVSFQGELGIRPGLNNINNPDNVLGNKLYLQGRFLYIFGFKSKV